MWPAGGDGSHHGGARCNEAVLIPLHAPDLAPQVHVRLLADLCTANHVNRRSIAAPATDIVHLPAAVAQHQRDLRACSAQTSVKAATTAAAQPLRTNTHRERADEAMEGHGRLERHVQQQADDLRVA